MVLIIDHSVRADRLMCDMDTMMEIFSFLVKSTGGVALLIQEPIYHRCNKYGLSAGHQKGLRTQHN